MPSVSGKQHRLMAMVANDQKAAKRMGIPQSVGQEFMSADKGRKFSEGGAMNMKHGSAAYMAKEKKHVEAMKKAGVPKKIVKEEAKEAGMKMARGGKTKMMASGGFTRAADGVAQKGKTKAKQIKMNKGGYCG
jgi:hypothetical protein